MEHVWLRNYIRMLVFYFLSKTRLDYTLEIQDQLN